MGGVGDLGDHHVFEGTGYGDKQQDENDSNSD
jgi:hypothetical protein